MGAPERTELHQVKHRCVARWRRTERLPYQSRGVWVQIGVLLADGRWYCDVIKPDVDECRPYPDEATARAVAHRWMAHFGGGWEQVQCYPPRWQPGERDG